MLEKLTKMGSKKLFLPAAALLLVFVVTFASKKDTPEQVEAQTKGSVSDTTVIDDFGDELIQVEDAVGAPQPLEFNIQGSVGAKAQGGLQTPRTASDLQPNAKTDQIPGPIEE